MLKFSANLGFLWSNLSLTEAIIAASKAGFDAVECHWPFNISSKLVKETRELANLQMVSLNTRPGNIEAGDFGLAAIVNRKSEACSSIREAIKYAIEINAKAVHVMAGRSYQGKTADVCFKENLIYAATLAATHDITILIEPINQRDVHGYHISFIEEALEIIECIKCRNVKILFDCYHTQIMEGKVIDLIESNIKHIGHIQIAAVPDRGEPNAGDLNYNEVFKTLKKLKYDGFVGAEYRPRLETEEGLGWLANVKANIS